MTTADLIAFVDRPPRTLYEMAEQDAVRDALDLGAR